MDVLGAEPNHVGTVVAVLAGLAPWVRQVKTSARVVDFALFRLTREPGKRRSKRMARECTIRRRKKEN